MRLAGAVGLLFAMSFPASAQWTDVRMPEHVYTAQPFTIDVKIDCPPPGEAPPPIGCNGTMGIWFQASDRSSVLPKGFTTIFPFATVRAGPFIFHKPGTQTFDIFTFSRENIGEIDLVGEVVFEVEPPGAANRKK
jgi:hypothetical protein